jgi:hypothetical protein
MFQNPAFYTFIFKNKDGCITDMVSIYKLDTVDRRCNVNCRNGYVYSCFFENDKVAYKFEVLECISEYCRENDIFDMITVVDCFGLSEKNYYTNKFLKGSGSLHYYFYNVEMFNVNPEDNGLITI